VASKKRLIIIDSNSIIHRAYHALPILTTKKGEQINAIYGFLLVFLKIIREFHPDFIAACFDFPAPTFRSKIFKKYKAKRPPAPEQLYQQIPKVKDVLKAFGTPVFEKKGFEADDLIGTIAKIAERKQIVPAIETIIVSGDLDALQLIDSQTKVYSLRKGVKDIILYDTEAVKEKYQGLTPSQIVDFKALRGDPSDNIPGVTGVGEKIAIDLLSKFGSLENLYKEIEEKSEGNKKLKTQLKETLLKYKEQAFFSQKLAQIEKNVPINFNLKKCQMESLSSYPKRKEKVIQVLKKYEFYAMIKKLSTFQEPIKQAKENLKLW